MTKKGGIFNSSYQNISLAEKKIDMKMIYAVEDILILMCLKKEKKSLPNNFKLQCPVPPEMMWSSIYI